MAIKQSIFPPTQCDASALESALAVLCIRGLVSRNQFNALTVACNPSLPALIELKQRSPKSVIYVFIDNVAKYEINNRSKINYIYS
jgi:hypothetical protein